MPAKKKPAVKRYSTHKTDKKDRAKHGKLRRVLLTLAVFALVGAILAYMLQPGDGRVSIVENAVGSMFTPVQNFFHSATDKVKGFVTTWRNYDALQEEYESLAFENEQLRMQQVTNDEALKENERLKVMLDARDTYSALDPIYAKIIARDPGPWFVSFSVNRGSNHGVAPGMAVVTGDGLVGRVTAVGLNYAKIRAIIDSRSGVACLMQRTRDNGVMRGQITGSSGSASCYVNYLPNINSITPGDVVVTSGTDSAYPKGLKIGTVSAVSLDAGSEGTYAVVAPSVDFQRLEEVFILRTVIETDSDSSYLPPVATPTVAYQAAATPAPDSFTLPDASDAPQNWSRPTVAPEVVHSPYEGMKVADLIEDTWASAS